MTSSARADSIRFQLAVALMACLGFSLPAFADVFYGTQDGKVYHNNLECPSGKKILEENRVKFATSKDAEDQGRRLCRTCERLAVRKKAVPKLPEPKPNPPAKATSRPAPTGRGTTTRPDIDPAHLAKVRSIQPGGTLILDTQEKIAFLGIGIPDRGQPCCDDTIAFLEAQHRAKRCVTSWDESPRPPSRDAYGRMRMYLQSTPGGPDLGGTLISQGLAWVDLEHPSAKQNEYLELEYQALSANRGIWKRLDGPAGLEKVETGRYARQFHPLNCPHHGHLIEPITITINEARARRLSPCEHYHVPAAKSRDNRTKGG